MTEASAHQGLIEITLDVQRNMATMETQAVVIDVGTEAWADEAGPRALPGDIVLITKLAGYMAKGPLDGKIYRLINDRDVFCRVTGEANV
jgi:hypothetical protein